MSIEFKAVGPAVASGILVVALSFGASAVFSPHTVSTKTNSALPPSGQSAAILSQQIIAGRDAFANTCAGCHGVDGAGASDAPSLHDEDLSDDDIADTIKNGSGRMPPFAKVYNDQQIKSLVGYIRTLK